MHRAVGALGTLALATVFCRPAAAQSTIKYPGHHPAYSFEAEPHLAVDPYGAVGIGPGFRGTFVVVDNGFVETINNSIGVGVGLDWLFYGDGCGGRVGPLKPRCNTVSAAMIPVVMQWNFWLHRDWSVFGEPGVIFHIQKGTHDDFALSWFTMYAGGRYHFSEAVSLTLRLGAPIIHHNTLSIGASFFL